MEAQPTLTRDEMVFMTDADKVAIESLARDGRSVVKPFLPGTIFFILLWIGLGYLVFRATENWIAVGCVAALWAAYHILKFISERKRRSKFAEMMKVGSVRLIEGVVIDYPYRSVKTMYSKAPEISLDLGGAKLMIFSKQVESLRYGATVELRVETTTNTVLSITVLKYGDHDLDWEAMPTPALEFEVDLTAEEAEFEKKVQQFPRKTKIKFYALMTFVFLGMAALSFWGFGWNWSLPAIGILYFYLIYKYIPKTQRLPAENQPLKATSGKKSVLEGILVRREVELKEDSDRVQAYFWVIGTVRRKLTQQQFVVAEPGDYVRLHSFGPAGIPFLVERVQKWDVANQASDGFSSAD